MNLLVDHCGNCPCHCVTMGECMLCDQLERDLDDIPVCSLDSVPAQCPLLENPLTLRAAVGPQS